MEASPGSWFAGLSAAERAALHGRGVARRYRTGAGLFHEGDLSDWVAMVTSGQVKVSSLTPDGKEVVLAICGPGELLGELSAIDSFPRSATATAVGPVEVRVVSGQAFREYLATQPGASLTFLRSLSGRLRDSDRRRVEFVALDSIGRVASQLIDLTERYGVDAGDGGRRIDLPITQDELAGLTGASREAVGKALQLFRRKGWVTTGRRTVTVVDPDGLRARAT
ncbi:MAG TPA: Crp/Fnr family transcriptional regulator [Acidimicrobiales bacterium]|jgi:CRP-like cAMP-binding protein|nr:Crp/Fnr family transcriptional regulator [Acidimicrobiales bacterium]